MDNSRDYFREFPLVTNLISKGREAISANQSLSSVTAEMQAFLRSDEIKLLINKCSSQFVDHPEEDPPFLHSDHIMLCNDPGGLVAGIGRTEEPVASSPIYSSTSEVMLGAISEIGFSYRLHKVCGNWSRDLFCPDVAISDPELRYCPAGATILVQTFEIFEYASADAWVLKIATPTDTSLMWEFDRSTQKAVRVYASTLSATTLTYITSFLGKYGNSGSVEAVKHLLKHPFHYIRWEAIKALGQLAPEALVEVLLALERDPHPHVSAASKKMLAKLGVR